MIFYVTYVNYLRYVKVEIMSYRGHAKEQLTGACTSGDRAHGVLIVLHVVAGDAILVQRLRTTRQSRIADFAPVRNAFFVFTAKLRCVGRGLRGMSVSGKQRTEGRSFSASAPPLFALPPVD